MFRSRYLAILVALLGLLAFGYGLVSAPTADAITLPAHCADLASGDCDNPFQCLVLCFMELAGLYDYCETHPADPRCF